MNSKIIGTIIIVIAISTASVYFLTKDEPINSSEQALIKNDKIGLVINTVNPPETIDDLENSYKIVSTSGIGRTNLYVHWDQLEPEKGTFDWRVTDIMMNLNNKYNLKTTLSVINADRLGPFPSWMGNQGLGKTLEDDTIRVLDAILSRYENIDYVIFAGDIDYHFQRATGAIPVYVEFFDNVSTKIKSNHPNVKIGNSLSLENIVNKELGPDGSFDLVPQLKMGDFIAFSYKPTNILGDIKRTSDNQSEISDTVWPAIDDLEESLTYFPDMKVAFFEISWSTSDFIDGNEEDQRKFIKNSMNFFEENESEIEFLTISRLFDKPKGTCVSHEIQEITGSSFSSNSYRLERIDEYVCNSGLIDTNENAKPAWYELKNNLNQ